MNTARSKWHTQVTNFVTFFRLKPIQTMPKLKNTIYIKFLHILMALLTYAQVSKFSDVREFFSAHKYKVLVLYYTCAKFLSSPNQKINGVGQ